MGDLLMNETKESVRNMIWKLMEETGSLRSNSFGRIPDFHGSDRAAKLLQTSREWEDAVTIFVSPDTALLKVRENVLYDRKQLIMASPKLLHGYILLEPAHITGNEKEASTIKGAFKFGKKLETFPKVDMVVEGSVAVDKYGGRLGKGGGYGDMEISYLREQKTITITTPVVSTVHEIQVIERVPLECHDQKINMVVTPERVLRID
jgi:5-formyltetrahydrofolate cyclo-ligase